ncbi:hypothetical protein ACJJTC_009221 [Scirpophaga incertulas]
MAALDSYDTMSINSDDEDLKTTPNLSLPAILRKKIPNYPYVRYLFSEVTTSKPLPDSNNYDLQLEETMIPQWQLSLRYDTKLCSDLGITVECGECNVSFAGWIHDCS